LSPEVLTEIRDRVLIVTLNRPEARNAVNSGLAEGLLAAVARLEDDDTLSVGVVTGAGSGFCAGMDLKEFASGSSSDAFPTFLRRGCAKPLVAAVEGFAMAGGLEIALTCDLIVASRSAKLGIPEAGVGLLAAGGALCRLPRRVPHGAAMAMALTGDPVDAVEAHRIGLVDRLTDDGRAAATALELASRIARNAPLSLSATKRLLDEGHGLTEAGFWDLQAPMIGRVFASEDALEGARAFAERRTPAWCGR